MANFRITWKVRDRGLVSLKAQLWRRSILVGTGVFSLRGDVDVEPWTKAIWTSRSIPRQSFHVWLLALNRIPTRDRLLSWGLQVPPLCLLCNNANESRDHLYWDCGFSFDLWSIVADRCRINPSRTWERSLNQMSTLTASIAGRSLTLLGWQATIYWIWNERYSRPKSSAKMMQLWFR